MKLLTFLAVVWVTVLGASTSRAADPIIGIWGGKWDDKWPTFFSVKEAEEPGKYVVDYYVLENTEHKSFTTQGLEGEASYGHYKLGFLSVKITDKTGMVYGHFPKPRMANLVKISDKVPSVAECLAVLEAAGWKPGAIPAEDALKKIEAKE